MFFYLANYFIWIEIWLVILGKTKDLLTVLLKWSTFAKESLQIFLFAQDDRWNLAYKTNLAII